MGNSEKLNHLSLCTGYGGIDLGLKRTLGNVRTVAYVEIEAYAVENLVNKIEANLLDVAPIWTNLKTFEWERFSNRVDILSGGFPCQPFSAAGRRQGDEDPRHLWPYIADGIKRLQRPPIIFFENVEGIISSKLKGENWSDPEGTSVLLHVLREMERLGYYSTASVFSASEVGASHTRKRVFILGVRNDLKQSGIEIINKLIESRSSFKDAWPARRGEKQFKFESSRVLANYTSSGLEGSGRPKLQRINGRSSKTNEPDKQKRNIFESEVGRNANGYSDRLDYGDLCKSVHSRIDELKLLGNGVVPATADRAFRILWGKLVNADKR